jgi:hypothetical protein
MTWLMLMASTGQMMKESTIASSRTEAERAKKRYVKPVGTPYTTLIIYGRLRTRIEYVKQSEEVLGEKRTHCASFSAPFVWSLLTFHTDKEVVGAFQNAMSLLGGL